MKLFPASLSEGQGAWKMARAIRVTPCSYLNALEVNETVVPGESLHGLQHNAQSRNHLFLP